MITDYDIPVLLSPLIFAAACIIGFMFVDMRKWYRENTPQGRINELMAAAEYWCAVQDAAQAANDEADVAVAQMHRITYERELRRLKISMEAKKK